jgi:thiamine-monophosphate kinase
MGDEFEDIRTLFSPLAAGAPGAFGLTDDAAAIPSRPGFDLVVTKDAMVAGVHFLADDPPGLVARKLLRVNLSDLAAKGAEPYGYFLSVHWPPDFTIEQRRAFADGLGEDQARFGIHLLGGDTVSTPGPLTATATLMGWVKGGAMVRRSGAKAGHVLLVSGVVGDGGLGLMAARGDLGDLRPATVEALASRYRLPEPRTNLAPAVGEHASAAADVSDGLVADAGHIARASGVGLEIDLERLPVSAPAQEWLAGRADWSAALVQLATAGDDYEIVCTAESAAVAPLRRQAAEAGTPLTPIGRVVEGEGVRVLELGVAVPVPRAGYRHF